jgi:PAS domain S-box-containing protein
MPTRPSIILVDDAHDVRQLVKTHLRLSGRLEVVGEGSDGDDAIELAKVHRPQLMLLDVSMPRRDGLAALPLVLEASPGTRVVMFSGFDEAGLAEHTRRLGASDFVEKSMPLDDLVDRLVGIADGRTMQSSPSEESSPEGDVRRGELHPVLADHLERFREIFEDAAIGMATITLDGRLVRVNRHLAGLLGRSPGELVGTPYADLAVETGAVQATLGRLRDGAGAVELEHALIDAQPGTRVRATLSPVLDAGGRPLYFFLQVQDISGQRAAEAELQQTEQRFRLLVEAVQDYAIFMLDPEGHIASWNAGAQRSKGYTADEIIGQHFRVFYPPDKQAERHPEHELELARLDGRYEEEGWRIRKDGTRFWAQVTITAVHDSEGVLVGFAKVTRDYSERRLMQARQEEGAAALAEANRSLETANEQLRLTAEEQADFLAVTAHELRSPVGVLAGSAETLARHYEQLTEEERTDFAASMRRNANQLRRLLNDLLTASRANSGTLRLQPVPLQLDEHISTTVLATRQAWPSADVNVDAATGITIEADPGRLSQMIDNLLVNAVQHGAPPVTVGARRSNGTVEITVQDAGSGVPPESRDRLFERFGTTTGGTGLGLYIVRELARAHGGDASYRPSDQAFVLSLPLTPNGGRRT